MKIQIEALHEALARVPEKDRHIVEKIFPVLLNLVGSREAFPVDLDRDYVATIEEQKRNVVEKKIKPFFKEGVDYITKQECNGARPRVCYLLTARAFKKLLQRHRKYGTVLTDYFLTCEQLAFNAFGPCIPSTENLSSAMQYMAEHCEDVVAEEHKRAVDRLVRKEGGMKEVRTKYGRADVVCYPFVIEVKEARLWKHALGQALAYAFDSDLKPRVHLYGGKLSTDVLRVFQRHGVTVTFDSLF